jgi:glycosyltransferase involved in cell wall biosynthesis
LGREAIAVLYQSADVALNPSRVDNMPNSILEALASGVPVVSTQVGGVPYMVDHGRTALLVPPQDPQTMAEAIARLLRDRELAHRLASAGLHAVQQFGWPAVKDQWIDIYARLMPKVRGRAQS